MLIMKLKNTVLTPAAICVFFASSYLNADILANYDFGDDAGTRSAASIVASDLGTASNMSKSWGSNFLGNVSGSGLDFYTFSTSGGFVIPDTIEESLAVSGNPGYIEFTFTPSESINLTSFSFDLGVFNDIESTYDVGAELFSSLTGFSDASQSLGGGTHTGQPLNPVADYAPTVTIDLTGESALQNIDSAVTFRVHYYDEAGIESGNAILRLDNVVLEGAAVPEPATIGFAFGVATLGLVLLRRRK